MVSGKIQYLHSNMVRFIINNKTIKATVNSLIYIPIWLDLLSSNNLYTAYAYTLFTFQYG